MADDNLHSFRDGETLRVLVGGLEIVRRQKHEWVPALATLSHADLVRRTGKVWGSKFLAHWTLSATVDLIETVVAEEGWVLRPGQASQVVRTFEEPVGLVAGNEVLTIRFVCDGRYVHAYPVER